MIIHINGMPGVGKLTTARILASQLGARLIDNHLIIDIVQASIGRTAGYVRMIQRISSVVLEEISVHTNEFNYVFTNALSAELKEDRERLEVIASFAARQNIPFVQVLLKCSLEENSKRLLSEERQQKGKLMDPSLLAGFHRDCTMYHPSAKFGIEIDTTSRSPQEVATEIVEFIRSNIA